MQPGNDPPNFCVQLAAQLQDKDVVVMDNVATHPANETACVTDYLLMVFCHQGTILSSDATEERLQAHDVSILMLDHKVLPVQVTADLRCTYVAVSRLFFKRLVLQYPYKRYDNLFRRRPPCHLTEQQFASALDAVALLRTISQTNSPYRQEQLVSLLCILYSMLGEYHVCNYPGERTSRQLVFDKFYDALVKHHCFSHEMAFYARICCLSPKHFSEVVREETGFSANEWISWYIITSAKSLLTSYENYTIQQISQHLGFSEQAAFARFFKRVTGMTPTAYRENSKSTDSSMAAVFV